MSLFNAPPIRLPVAVFDFQEDSGSVADNDTFLGRAEPFRIPSVPALLDLNLPTISP